MKEYHDSMDLAIQSIVFSLPFLHERVCAGANRLLNSGYFSKNCQFTTQKRFANANFSATPPTYCKKKSFVLVPSGCCCRGGPIHLL